MVSKYEIPYRDILKGITRLEALLEDKKKRQRNAPKEGECWLCYDIDTPQNKFLRTESLICKCSGSIRNIHISCFSEIIDRKIKARETLECYTCKQAYSQESLDLINQLPEDFQQEKVEGLEQGVWGTWHLYYQKDDKGRIHGEYYRFHQRNIQKHYKCEGCIRGYVGQNYCPGHTQIVREKKLVRKCEYFQGKLHNDLLDFSWENGEIIKSGSYFQGIKNGQFTEFCPNTGKELKSENYSMGAKDGIFISNTELYGYETIRNYVQGVMEGPQRIPAIITINAEKFNCIQEITYKNDVSQNVGIITYYNQEGRKLRIDSYDKDGKLHGKQELYLPYSKEKLISSFQYEYGVLHGESNTYFDNGNLKSVCQYTNGLKSGWEITYSLCYHTIYNIQYKEKSRTYYSNGLIQGNRSYNLNGYFKIQGNYVDGKEDGEFLLYDEHNCVNIESVNYKDGILHGKYLRYNQKGILKQSANYDSGILTGPIKFYDDVGLLQFSCMMNNNTLKIGSIAQYYDHRGNTAEKYGVEKDQTLDDYLECLEIKFYYPGTYFDEDYENVKSKIRPENLFSKKDDTLHAKMKDLYSQYMKGQNIDLFKCNIYRIEESSEFGYKCYDYYDDDYDCDDNYESFRDYYQDKKGSRYY